MKLHVVMGVLLTLCGITAAQAQVASAKGTAVASYSGKLTPEVKAKAFHDAEVNAIERYVAESGASQTESFDLIRDKVSAAIADYVLGATVISEENRQDARQYSVVVRVDLNAARLRNVLKNSSVVANTATQQKSPLTFVFVARAQDSVQSFDARTFRRADAGASDDRTRNEERAGSEGESVGASRISTSSNASVRTSVQAATSSTIETGGSTTRRADQVTWALIPAGNINAIVTGVFGAAAFDVVEVEYVEPKTKGLLSLRALQDDYRGGNDLQPRTLQNTVQGLQAAQVPYLALATLDVGLADNDPATGLARVYVTVTGKLIDVTGRFPRTVASVGPEQFAGIGSSPNVAQTNALKLAADKAARELVSQINVAGIH